MFHPLGTAGAHRPQVSQGMLDKAAALLGSFPLVTASLLDSKNDSVSLQE